MSGTRQLLFLALGCAATASLPGRAVACAYDPGSMVYASACGVTTNFQQGQAYFLDSQGVLQMSDTNDLAVTITPAPFQTPGVLLNTINGTSREGTSRQVSFGFGQVGTLVNGDYTDFGFAAGDPNVSLRHIVGDTLVPNLHAEASGSAQGAATASNAISDGSAAFSDVISIGPAQLAAANRILNRNLTGVYVDLQYVISGNATASGTLASGSSATASAGFAASGQNSNGVQGVDFSFDFLSSFDSRQPDGPRSTVSGLYIVPGVNYVLQVSLEAYGSASARPGDTTSYDADFADTAAFLGARFYADAARTQELPAFDLNSYLGFNYDPILPVESGGGGGGGDGGGDGGGATVPEPASFLLLASLAAPLAVSRRPRRRSARR